MKNTIIKDTIILTLITLVSGGLLGLVYQVTKEPIAQQEEMAKQEAYQAVFEDADSFEVCVEAGDADIAQYLADNGFTAQTVNEVMEAKDASGETIGYALNMTTSEGYGGDISFSMGVQLDGTLNGISILTINETAGLGMNATDESFKGQFSDKNVDSFHSNQNRGFRRQRDQRYQRCDHYLKCHYWRRKRRSVCLQLRKGGRIR